VLALECAIACPDQVESLLLCDLDPAEAPQGWSVAERLDELTLPVLVAHGFAEGREAPPVEREIVAGLGDARWLILGQSGRSVLHGPEADVALPAIRSFVLKAAL
jgi:hypothetical protein